MRIQMYEGSRSQRLQSMINDKLKAKRKEQLPEIAKNKELIRARVEYLGAKERFKNAEAKLNEVKEKLGIDFDSDGKMYVIHYCCAMPIDDIMELQRASDLYALGKKKEANAIWDAIIKKYGIGE